MGAELPALSAIVARLTDPEIHLAAYGGVVFPLAMIIESPIIMLLSASTALSKDWDSYLRLRRFMMSASAILTIFHLVIVLTPLYDFIVVQLLGVPGEIIEPARIGLLIMTPWTWSIAYRRFHQGVLIRFGHPRAVGLGTIIRLSANLLILMIGFLLGTLPGIVVATSAVACGVVSEAIFVGLAVRPVLKLEVRLAPVLTNPLTRQDFVQFYIPLALTSLINLLVNPLGSAALSRMPEALTSLAVWPVVSGLIFLLRSMGIAYNEVVVALLDQPGSSTNLRRFTILLMIVTTFLLLLVAATPVSKFWFEQISALPPHLAELARRGIWLAIPLPALTALQSWYQGAILHSRQTRGITESIVIYLATSVIVLGAGVLYNQVLGLYIGLTALTFSILTQTTWLWLRSLQAIRQVESRDQRQSSPETIYP